MTDTRLDVLDRVRKLLNLSKDSDNENEAALAAHRAARLMERHEIHEAELRLAEDTASIRTPEPIDTLRATSTRKCVAWHSALAYGLSRKLHCHYYFHGGAIIFFGRLTAIQTASYTLQYLVREVERLCDAHCTVVAKSLDVPRHVGNPSRKYRNAFRLGCATRISDRLLDGVVERVAVAVEAPAVEAPAASAGVLAIIKKDHDEVDAAYKAKAETFNKRNTNHLGSYSSARGFDAGVRAGNKANLGGGARGGLPRGQGVLP